MPISFAATRGSARHDLPVTGSRIARFAKSIAGPDRRIDTHALAPGMVRRVDKSSAGTTSVPAQQ
jgi:hypothetical protein